MLKPVYEERIEGIQLSVFSSREEMGEYLALEIADCMKALLQKKDKIRMVFAAAPSQIDFLRTLVNVENIEWDRVEAFHMDEYIGLKLDAPQRFSTFLNKYIFDVVKPGTIHLIMPENQGAQQECTRYANLLEEEKIDIVCLGIGENGHIAFNDPSVADFNDQQRVKIVKLDQECRQQQVNDGCFLKIEDVPTHAITLTIPMLLAAENLFTIVPGRNKMNALHRALREDITTECPASILRTHESCKLFADKDSYPL